MEGFSIILSWVREGRAAKPQRGELQNAKQKREESGKNQWRGGEARGEMRNRETEEMEGKRLVQGHKQRLCPQMSTAPLHVPTDRDQEPEETLMIQGRKN